MHFEVGIFRAGIKKHRAPLTNKLWRSKDVFKLHPRFDFVGESKVDEFDSGQRSVFLQQHDVLWLQITPSDD